MLLRKLKEDLFAARKAGNDKLAISLLTTLYSEAANVGLNDKKRESTDAEVMSVVKKFLKGVDECISVGVGKGVDVSKYEAEKTLLNNYLPKCLTLEELSSIIKPLKESGLVKGLIMKTLKEQYTGQYDGKLAADLIDNL